MNLYRLVRIVVLIPPLIITGCGGGSGGFDPNQVTVTVSPETDTIANSDTLTLQAAVHGLCSTCPPTINGWSVTENSGDPRCNWFDAAPDAPCPGGTIQETTGGNFLTVTYHPPSISGTFHVIAEWCVCFGSSIKKDGTSTITVSP